MPSDRRIIMLDSLSSKIQKILRDLKGEGRISERHLEESLRQVRIVLLEADVNFKVVKNFISRVKTRSLGAEVLSSLTPGQHIVGIVRDELTDLLGGETAELTLSSKSPTVILVVGLQGSGKTTTSGKLAVWLKDKAYQTLMVSTDVYRPAAIEQLSVIAGATEISVFEDPELVDPVERARKAWQRARNMGFDVLLVDTAGRLHSDEELMQELEAIRDAVEAREILLVADSMTGQDAVNSAQQFDQRLNLSGVILSKMDADARGGAALSIREVSGKPIKFVGTGEAYDALEVFHPARMAGRILGMGDVLRLVEKAEETASADQAERMLRKIQRDEFTLDDFLEQMVQLRKMGPLEQILGMLPQTGMFKGLDKVQVDEKELDHLQAIIFSMTAAERVDYKIIKASRRRRIARGSGRPVSEVNRLLKQYLQARKMMKQVKKGFLGKGLPRFNLS